jgi:mRNA-degrading endonuclease RelE of RelBE toxin-antitoxin system
MKNNKEDIKAAFESIIERNKENNWLNPKLVISENEGFFRIKIDGFDEIKIENHSLNRRIELFNVVREREGFRLLYQIIYTK